MKRNLIRYRISPERVSENATLIKGVFEELNAKSPNGLRYAVLNLDDGGFVHVVETENEPSLLTQLESFRAFQRNLKDRQIEPAVALGVTIVGNYRMLAK